MPYSTACNTPLSNFESGLDYRDVSDPAIMARTLPLPHAADVACCSRADVACRTAQVAFPIVGDADNASLVRGDC